MQNTFSIIIPAYNSSRTIAKTIEACLNQDVLEIPEIIVVDDGSSDNTKAIIKNYPVKYLYQGNAGPATARNRGWKNAQGSIICFTDSDCIPEKNWIKKISLKFEDSSIAAVGGSYEIANSRNLLADCIHQEIVFRHTKIPEDVNYLGSFNVAYRKDILVKTGGFDESFKMASAEDNDLSYRVKNLKYKLVFDNNIKVSHFHPEKLGNYLKSQFWHGFWRVKLYKKHATMAKGDHYAGFLDLIQPPLALLSLALLPFVFIGNIAFLVISLLLFIFLLQLPLSLRISLKLKDIKYIHLSLVSFLRVFARALGLLLGLTRLINFKADEK